jgi:hypothetical protein
MENVRLRMSTDEEAERIRQFLMPERAQYLDWFGCLAVDHDGGIGYVVAGMMFVHLEGEPKSLGADDHTRGPAGFKPQWHGGRVRE